VDADDDGVAPEGDDSVAPEGDVAVAPPPDEQCGCEPTGEFACEIVETACAQDSDCPADWTCEDNPMGTCWADSEGNSGCTPADPAKLCQPPYSGVRGGDGYAQTTGGEAGTVDIARSDDGSIDAEAPKTADPDANGWAASGDSGPSGAAPEDADGHASAADTSPAGSSVAGGGCSVSSSSGRAGQFGLMLVAAMAALGLRRRSAR
jgi:MYXO-CTERM domain-containing protein